MFNRKKHAPPQKRIDCLIGAGTTVDGNVTFSGGLRIDGIVRGNVTTANGETGTLVVPIAHNAGHFWRRRSILKKPGLIRVVIGPPIDPKGLTAREVNERAQQWIEAKIAEIIAQPGGQPD